MTYGGGVVQRGAPQTDVPQAGTLSVNTVFQSKDTKVVGDVTFAELVTGNWVVIQKGDLVTCEKLAHKFKVVYGGGAVVRSEPKSSATPTGAKQDHNSVFEPSDAAPVVEGDKVFVEMKTGGWVVQKLGEQVICMDITEGDPTAALARNNTNSRGGGAGIRVVDGVLPGGERPSFPTGQSTVVIAPPAQCSDVALIGLKYSPPNSTFQISKTGHYITYRKGIWNRTAPVSNSSSERSDSSVQGAHNSSIVYSVEGVPLRLTDAAVAKIKHSYTGEPLLVTMKLNRDCCELECGGGTCCGGHTAYNDDSVDVRGIWFGEKDAVPEPTVYSDAGCMCILPPQLQHALQHLYLRPPSKDPCTELCNTVCKGPPLINHVAIDAYEVKIEYDRNKHARIYSSLTSAEAAASSISGRSSSAAGSNDTGTGTDTDTGTGIANPMTMDR